MTKLYGCIGAKNPFIMLLMHREMCRKVEIGVNYSNIAQTSSMNRQYSRTGHSDGLMSVNLVLRRPHCQV